MTVVTTVSLCHNIAGLRPKEECVAINSGPLRQEVEVRPGGAGRLPLRGGRHGLAQGGLLGGAAQHR